MKIPWKLIIVAAVFTFGMQVGIKWEAHGWLEATNKAVSKAIEGERKQQESINKGLQEQLNDQIDISNTLADDLSRLQQRTSRAAKQATRVKCTGATGAELSKQDAGFLIREAARADTIRAGLKACYHYADSIREYQPE